MPASVTSERIIRQAIYLAQGGNRERARELFLHAVEMDSENLTAWLWLVDLHENLADQITACRNAYSLAPDNEKIHSRLKALLRQYKLSYKPVEVKTITQIQQAERLRALGKREEAQAMLHKIVEKNQREVRAWELLGELAEESGDQIFALENLLALQPDNQKARERLTQLQHFRENPFDLAAKLEEEGKLDEALAVYHKVAREIQYGPEFDLIFKNITRLEIQKNSGVVYVKPVYSIARLTGGPVLLYLLLMLVHNQLNLFALTPLLWVGMIATLAGGFFLAVASVRSRHPIWMKFFDEPGGGGSPLARFTLSLAGWLLLCIAFTLLLTTSFDRLPLVNINTIFP